MCFTGKCKYERNISKRCALLPANKLWEIYRGGYTLLKSEVICDVCKGRGLFTFKRKIIGSTDEYVNILHTCGKCRGYGILDWIDNLITKETHSTHIDKIPNDSYCSTNNINL